MKQALFFNKLSTDSRAEMIGPRLAVNFDDGVVIPPTYKEQIEMLRPKLEGQKVIQHIIDFCCLIENEDDFNGDETFAFHRVEYKDFRLVYSFKNKDGKIVKQEFLIENVYIV